MGSRWQDIDDEGNGFVERGSVRRKTVVQGRVRPMNIDQQRCSLNVQPCLANCIAEQRVFVFGLASHLVRNLGLWSLTNLDLERESGYSGRSSSKGEAKLVISLSSRDVWLLVCWAHSSTMAPRDTRHLGCCLRGRLLSCVIGA